MRAANKTSRILRRAFKEYFLNGWWRKKHRAIKRETLSKTDWSL